MLHPTLTVGDGPHHISLSTHSLPPTRPGGHWKYATGPSCDVFSQTWWGGFLKDTISQEGCLCAEKWKIKSQPGMADRGLGVYWLCETKGPLLFQHQHHVCLAWPLSYPLTPVYPSTKYPLSHIIPAVCPWHRTLRDLQLFIHWGKTIKQRVPLHFNQIHTSKNSMALTHDFPQTQPTWAPSSSQLGNCIFEHAFQMGRQAIYPSEHPQSTVTINRAVPTYSEVQPRQNSPNGRIIISRCGKGKAWPFSLHHQMNCNHRLKKGILECIPGKWKVPF